MSTKNRDFNIGRQSGQLYNEELFRLFESIRPLLLAKEAGLDGPTSETQGALWLDQIENELKSYQKTDNTWLPVFDNKFRITNELLHEVMPLDPIKGQLWIHQGMLWFYNGTKWTAVRAHDPNDSDIYFSTFEDFLLLSPMQKQKNNVVDSGSTINKSQFLTPNLKTGRFYRGQLHETTIEKMNQIAFQYEASKLTSATPSWVHVNPARLTDIKKRFVRIYSDQRTIDIPTKNTEFYGYKANSPLGKLLRPIVDSDDSTGEYLAKEDGIVLTNNAVNEYNYLLAITYEFSWIKSSGLLHYRNSKVTDRSFYIENIATPVNLFIEGLDLENDFFGYNEETKTIDADPDEVFHTDEVSVMSVIRNEYGFIQQRNLAGDGIIRLRKHYKNPLVILNGLAYHVSHNGFTKNEELISIPGAKRGMTYSAIELEDENENMFFAAPIANQDDRYSIPNLYLHFPPTSGIIVFVDGLLVKKEEVVLDYTNNRILINGLKAGSELIILKDANHRLLFEEAIKPALGMSKFDHALVFMNGGLLIGDGDLLFDGEESAAVENAYGEIREFAIGGSKVLKQYNAALNKWQLLGAKEAEVKSLVESYAGAITAIMINISYTRDDVFDCYGYSYANTAEGNLMIASLEWDALYDSHEIQIPETYPYYTNTLQVYLNGVRLTSQREDPRRYGYKENISGRLFTLRDVFGHIDEPHYTRIQSIISDTRSSIYSRSEAINLLKTVEAQAGIDIIPLLKCKITYVIELPKKGTNESCQRIVLDNSHVLNTPNIYKSATPLYPGWLTVYVNGLRMPNTSFTLLDNNIIKLNDPKIKLFGDEPSREIMVSSNPLVVKEQAVTKPDIILIEIRQEYERQEYTRVYTERHNNEIQAVGTTLPLSILDTRDEIMIYINGLYTGYKHDIHYQKDQARGLLRIIDTKFPALINHDPIYTLLESDPALKTKWVAKHGMEYEEKLKNVYTLEWR